MSIQPMLHHNHLCRHCDTTWSDSCDDGEYDASKRHDCWQRKWYAQKLAIALGDDAQLEPYPTVNPITLREMGEKLGDYRARMVAQRERQLAKFMPAKVIMKGKNRGKHRKDCLCRKCCKEFAWGVTT